jgi:hypothetical protein
MTPKQQALAAELAKQHEPSPVKAATMLHDGTAHGHALTDKQRKFFGARSHGMPPLKKP